MKIEYKQVEHSDIFWLNNAAKRERVVLSDGKDHFWFAAFDGEQMVAVGGCAILRGNVGRMKGFYVLPEYRGRRISTALNNLVFDFLKEKHCSCITAYATTKINVFWYLKNGFTKIWEKNGIAFVKRGV